ncbi:AAA family ATPase [Actinacidiphila glaucinigra]|uniref:helix-turn-helix transcriptional regulator n=1 Tax=Actinacidiphila glaucinigra TaxID=235986 RepID=UPI002DDBD642|nr:AAA family ATPase [Actinacidiphila glaucinigra]WSD63758.1 AAA family ATPase [Actinacidiphila glaucinigra]
MSAPTPAGPRVSPVFVGRQAELAELLRAADAADDGDPQAVLIRGEAGVGKTRLVGELLRSLEARAAVAAVGGCVELGGDGLPFAPFSEALRVLWRRLPDEVRAASAGHEDLLARILPGPEGATSADQRDDDVTRLFELTTRVLERLAADRLVVLVVEDLHWADASTRNLLSYLFRTRRRGRLLLLGTYRSDDIDRRHPLRPLLAELGRLRSVRRVALPRFTRGEVGGQLAGILGAPPDPAVLDEVFARSDGNAFFVEELAAGGRDHPGTGLHDLHDLRDVLLPRLESLPETSQHILRTAAEGGAATGYALLREVAGLPEDELIEGLRAAVLAQVLVPEPDGSDYRFRHSLVRETVSETLLPGERALINRRYAKALEADPALVPAVELSCRLARHWHAAQDFVKALRMSVTAAEEARHCYAYTEQLWHLERALQLWDRVPDEARAALPAPRCPQTYPRGGPGQEGAGPARLDLLATAVVAALHCGSLDTALRLADTALAGLPPEGEPHRLRAAWFRTQRSRLIQGLNRGDGWQDLETARKLVEGLAPSPVHADVLVHIANWSAVHPGPDNRAAADEAVRYASALGAEALELHARMTRCLLDSETDGDGDGIAELYEVRRRAEELGELGIAGRANQNLPSILEGMGRSEEAVAAADHGIALCRSLGLADHEGWVHSNRSISLFSLGRWAESEAALDEAAAVARSHLPRWTFAARRAYHLLHRGDADGAARQLALADELRGTEQLQTQLQVALSHCTMEIAVGQGRLADARAEFLRADAAGLTTGPVRWSLPMLRTAAAVEAEARGSASLDGPSPDVLAAIRRAAGRLDAVFPVWAGYERLLQAELGRAEGDDDPDLWSLAVTAFATVDRPYESAAALHGEGRALLAGNQRRAAALDRLGRARGIATGLGAGLLLADVEAAIRRAGTDPAKKQEAPAAAAAAASSATAGEPAPFGLTPRESEVLGLVAKGYSNRRISEELYISQKTTSTHVSNILAKLGASSRTEAAAMAHWHGLPPSP